MTKIIFRDNLEKLRTQKEVRGALWNSFVGLFAVIFTFLLIETLAGLRYIFIPVNVDC